MLLLFGASGDIHKKKVYPGLYELFNKGYKFKVLGIGRSKYTNDSYHKLINKTLKNGTMEKKVKEFLNCFEYLIGNYNDISTYINIETKIKIPEKDKLILYCGVPSYVTLDIIKNIKERGIYDKYNTIFMVEKPFGNNINEYIEYTEQVVRYVKEDSIKLIDHI